MSKLPFSVPAAADIPARLAAIEALMANRYERSDEYQALSFEHSYLTKHLEDIRSAEQTVIQPNRRVPVGTQSPIR